MKLQVERDGLITAVNWAARAIPGRPTAPVLAGILLEAGDGLALSGFDYETSARAVIPVRADEPGTVLVSGRLLAEIARSLPARPVDLSTDGTKMTVRCGTANFTMLLLPAGEYPTLPAMPDVTGTVGADAFATAIRQVAPAAGRDDTLPALSGIRIEIAGDTLTLVTTDRYRLAIRTLPWTVLAEVEDTALLVPARVLTESAKALAAAPEVAIALGPRKGDQDPAGLIGFEGGGHTTTTRLLSGEYPKYQTLLPSQFSAEATLPAAQLTEAVRRVALVAERNTPVRLAFSRGEVLLEAGTGDEAQATEAIETAYEGEPLQIAFNPQYLIDGLAAIDAETARISFTSPTRPAVITSAGDTSPAFRYVIMPIRSAG